MYIVSMNIGYDTKYGSAGILNTHPIMWEFESMSEFTEVIRTSCLTLAKWAMSNYVPKGSIVLYVGISRSSVEDGENYYYTNEYAIRCENIREYKPYIMMDDSEIEAL